MTVQGETVSGAGGVDSFANPYSEVADCRLSELSISSTDGMLAYVGGAGGVTSHSVVYRNVFIDGVRITGNTGNSSVGQVGGFVGNIQNGTASLDVLENCHVTGLEMELHTDNEEAARTQIGGFAGTVANGAELTNCSAEGWINAADGHFTVRNHLADLANSMRTVTFDANGGTGTMAPQGVVSGTATTLNANTFTREGYTFNGWSTNQSGGGTTYTDGQSVTLTADTTLYAQWRSNYSGGGNGGNTTYAPTISETKNGTVSVDPKSASSGTKVTITATPNEGYEVGTVTVKDANGKAVEVTKNADGSYSFTQPAGKVTIDVTFVEENILGSFTDVDASAWYADAVKWALKNGVMSGYGNGKFGPGDTTSRAMMAQILWNMEGKPVVNYAMNYTDVAADVWYAEAVRWATAQGIMSGYGHNKFGPNDDMTREQLVTIMYRYAQLKKVDVSIGEDTNILSYDDAFDVSEWAIPAMQWAVGAGIVNGTSASTLSPKDNASRAEIAAIVMRYCEKVAE